MPALKIMTVLGTRPEIIRLSCILPSLKKACDHVLVHTGQNFDARLSELFFRELELDLPDHNLEIRETATGKQVGQIIARCDELFEREKPDRLMLLGDTNSSLCALIAKRRGIKVIHLEAGNRCYDDRVPEEVNRRIIDHSSDVLLPYTEQSRRNLQAEGIPGRRIYVTGNPIYEVLQRYMQQIDQARALEDLDLKPKQFYLVTLHRTENVDQEGRLKVFIGAFAALAKRSGLPVVVSTHPRTRNKLQQFSIITDSSVILAQPFGFFDFVKLEKTAKLVLTDSGTVQEECCILGVPTVTLRDVTERPETIECGSNMLTGCDQHTILSAIDTWAGRNSEWTPPVEYVRPNVSDTIVNIMTNFYL